LIASGVNEKRPNHLIQQTQMITTTVANEHNPADKISDMPQLDIQEVSAVPKPIRATTSDYFLFFYVLFFYMNFR